MISSRRTEDCPATHPTPAPHSCAWRSQEEDPAGEEEGDARGREEDGEEMD
jgi:hypothetical protein